MADTELYKALGVAPDASADEIKRAYRKMARKFHPDVNADPEADTKFKAAAAANDVLSDPEKRAAYDRYGASWDQPRSEQTTRQDDRWQGGFAFDERDVNPDMFRDFFGDRPVRGGMPRDQHAAIEISLEDAITGAKKALTLQSPQIDKTGHVTMQTRRIDLTIPKGVLPGQNLRLKGKGAEGADLLIEVSFRPHPIYTIEGRDLYVTLPVTPWEAALGGKVPMPTPTGTVDLTIPPDARQGQKLRLKGRGMPAAQKGDLYAILQIVNPSKLSPKARDLYQQLAEAQPHNPRSKLGV
ncbi:curved DNA-binding protein [Yoonia rosea]|uniref:Curved DNA-binding protein n=1 Tax=Yoonia rosea TaxID=287098 RepID=A0A1R3X9G0_9RHOB|nr:DnaJ C-terminal domain-containing protein [Yoonia rosea]SIT87792.1 curved DNA-binding protein [Yoonia rosea]